MYEQFTDRARKVMQLANQEAQRFNHEYIGVEHILLGLVKLPCTAAEILEGLDVNPRTVRLEVEKLVRSGPAQVIKGRLPQTPVGKKAIDYAMEESRNLDCRHVGTEHLLLALSALQTGIAFEVLQKLGLDHAKLRTAVAGRDTHDQQTSNVDRPVASKSPALDDHGRWLAKKPRFPPCPERDEEIRRMQVVLNRHARRNVLLVGEPTCGVRWLAETFATKLSAEGDARHAEIHLVELELSRLLRAKHPAEVIQAIAMEAERTGNIVLFVDRIDAIIDSEVAGLELLAAMLVAPQSPVVATTTSKGHAAMIACESPVLANYVPVKVAPATGAQALAMLRAFANRLTEIQGIQVSDKALATTIELADTFLHNQHQPGAGIDVIDYAMSITDLRTSNENSVVKGLVAERDQLRDAMASAVSGHEFEQAASYKTQIRDLEADLVEQPRKWHLEQNTLVELADIIQAVSDLAEVDRGRVEESCHKRNGD